MMEEGVVYRLGMAATSGSTSLTLFASFRMPFPMNHTSLLSYRHLPLPLFLLATVLEVCDRLEYLFA